FVRTAYNPGGVDRDDALNELSERALERAIPVNNAGVSLAATSDGADYEDAWDATLAVNLTGYVRMIRACRPHLLDAGGGRIVNMVGRASCRERAGITVYTAGMQRVVGVTSWFACVLAPPGMAEMCLCPG